MQLLPQSLKNSSIFPLHEAKVTSSNLSFPSKTSLSHNPPPPPKNKNPNTHAKKKKRIVPF